MSKPYVNVITGAINEAVDAQGIGSAAVIVQEAIRSGKYTDDMPGVVAHLYIRAMEIIHRYAYDTKIEQSVRLDSIARITSWCTTVLATDPR